MRISGKQRTSISAVRHRASTWHVTCTVLCFGLMEGIGIHMAVSLSKHRSCILSIRRPQNWCATSVPGLINSINTNIHVGVCTRLFDVAYLLGVSAGP